MYRRFLFLFLSTFLIPISGKAQLGKEAWHWRFGHGGGLNFSSGQPVLEPAMMGTIEGTAVMSDRNTGQLLISTDGTNVWDCTGLFMPNGLGGINGGMGTSTQAAIIVPKPGSKKIYYLISADQGGYATFPAVMGTGVHYSIIDLSLNGGKGDITLKNQLLTPPPTTEKLTAVRHCNGRDYWIITHPFNSGDFYAYLLTSSGLNLTPVVSTVGTIHEDVSGGTYWETIGYMKASPDGKKLALGISFWIPILELFDFDNSNGKVSSPITITYPPYFEGIYGVSFSPDNTKVYASQIQTGLIYQYDISTFDYSSVVGSEAILDVVPNPGALQLGPDGKLYFTSLEQLCVINNPNSSAANCVIQTNIIPFPMVGTLEIGLPNFIDGGLNDNYTPNRDTAMCTNTGVVFHGDPNFTNFLWSNGDTTHLITAIDSGTYWVTSSTKQCSVTDTMHIKILPPVRLDNLKDISECGISFFPMLINANYQDAVSCTWNDGTVSDTNTVSAPGTYSVIYKLTNGGCANDSFNVSFQITKFDNSFPNIVTPNNDGVNDYIDFGSFNFTSMQLEIFDRWGVKIFESNDPSCVWKPSNPDGTYFYVVNYQNDCVYKKHKLKGFITVVN